MKAKQLPLLLLLLLFSSTFTIAQNSEKQARDVVEKAISAMGGMQLIKNINKK